jgi:hypothetical protein
VSLPYLSDPIQNPVVAILDCKTAPGRIPKKVDSLLLIPAQYFVVRKNGFSEWVHQKTLKQRSERALILGFERKYPRSKGRVCEPVSSYPSAEQEDEVVDSEGEAGSPDAVEYDANWELDLHEYFRDAYHCLK